MYNVITLLLNDVYPSSEKYSDDDVGVKSDAVDSNIRDLENQFILLAPTLSNNM